MTSDTLRKILIAAAMVTALAVVAVRPTPAKAIGDVELSAATVYKANQYCHDAFEYEMQKRAQGHNLRRYIVVDENGVERDISFQEFSDEMIKYCVHNIEAGGPSSEDFPGLELVPPETPSVPQQSQ